MHRSRSSVRIAGSLAECGLNALMADPTIGSRNSSTSSTTTKQRMRRVNPAGCGCKENEACCKENEACCGLRGCVLSLLIAASSNVGGAACERVNASQPQQRPDSWRPWLSVG